MQVDVIGLAKDLGFVIARRHFINNKDEGFIMVDEKKGHFFGYRTNKIIVVNSNRDLRHKLFSIAKSLACYFLEYVDDPNKNEYYFKQIVEMKDDEKINDFARNILMPKIVFIKEFKKLEEKYKSRTLTITELSKKFNTTILETKRRISELNLK